MHDDKPTRRRLLKILAAAGAAVCTTGFRGHPAFEWQGTALGADVRIILLDADAALAAQAARACMAEIERLERIFSLYLDQSELSRLNRQGVLEQPSLELKVLLQTSQLLHRITGGLFDPTVQPLWRAYATWYEARPGQGPLPAAEVSALLSRIGLDRVQVDHDIRLLPGTQITLNGIAQGFITDRVADILRRHGLEHVLLDLGEVSALGGRPDGTPFKVAIRESDLQLLVADASLATSSAGSLMFSSEENLAHILNPANGRTASPWRGITVRHRSATLADGLSTALVLADLDTLEAVADRVRGVRVWATRRDGTTLVFG